jgi:hypothetical protein
MAADTFRREKKRWGQGSESEIQFLYMNFSFSYYVYDDGGPKSCNESLLAWFFW